MTAETSSNVFGPGGSFWASQKRRFHERNSMPQDAPFGSGSCTMCGAPTPEPEKYDICDDCYMCTCSKHQNHKDCHTDGYRCPCSP